MVVGEAALRPAVLFRTAVPPAPGRLPEAAVLLFLLLPEVWARLSIELVASTPTVRVVFAPSSSLLPSSPNCFSFSTAFSDFFVSLAALTLNLELELLDLHTEAHMPSSSS